MNSLPFFTGAIIAIKIAITEDHAMRKKDGFNFLFLSGMLLKK